MSSMPPKIAEAVPRLNNKAEETKQQAMLAMQPSHIRERPVESETPFSMPLDPNTNNAISIAAGANAKINMMVADSLGPVGRSGS